MALQGKLITESLDYDGGRQVTAYLPSQTPEALVFAADGGWHTARLVEALEACGGRPTMVVGVHGMPDDDGRLKEYVEAFDPERFRAHEEFFVHEARDWVHSRFPVELPPGRTAVWGASLGAELALAMGMRHPDIYGVVLAASPGAGFRPSTPMPSPTPRVYLVAGRQEEFFLENATRWADALHDVGVDCVMVEREGSHGGDFWFEEFPLMVTWAFGE